jgi:hypothetical protein
MKSIIYLLMCFLCNIYAKAQSKHDPIVISLQLESSKICYGETPIIEVKVKNTTKEWINIDNWRPLRGNECIKITKNNGVTYSLPLLKDEEIVDALPPEGELVQVFILDRLGEYNIVLNRNILPVGQYKIAITLHWTFVNSFDEWHYSNSTTEMVINSTEEFKEFEETVKSCFAEDLVKKKYYYLQKVRNTDKFGKTYYITITSRMMSYFAIQLQKGNFTKQLSNELLIEVERNANRMIVWNMLAWLNSLLLRQGSSLNQEWKKRESVDYKQSKAYRYLDEYSKYKKRLIERETEK